MLYYLSGTVTVLEPGLAVIDRGGVGYGCRVTAYTASQLKLNAAARLFITESIREDAFDLYGFASREEQRWYGLFIANKVLGVDRSRATPAWTRNDGLDYVPTNKHVLFGHHFAAIAGAGPLVGPVLAAQMGYLPGTLWLIAGVVLAGAVQDFMVLFISSRRDGRSLGELVREEMGPVPGTIALFGVFMIMIIILAVLAMIVVKALAESAWGMFTVIATMPIAILMGIYMRYIRPGRIGEISIVGLVLLIAAIIYGGLIVMFLPSFVERKLSLRIPNYMFVLYFVFLYCAIYLGEVWSFYYRIPFWDMILHTFSGMMLGALGFSLVSLLNSARLFVKPLERDHPSFSPSSSALATFCFVAVSSGVFTQPFFR